MLDKLFAYQASMPTSTTSNNDEATGAQQALAMIDYCTENDAVVVGHQTATHAIAKTLRLFEDLLKHEVREFALVQHAHVHVYLFHVGVDMLL